jgi:hypothetical protein
MFVSQHALYKNCQNILLITIQRYSALWHRHDAASEFPVKRHRTCAVQFERKVNITIYRQYCIQFNNLKKSEHHTLYLAPETSGRFC